MLYELDQRIEELLDESEGEITEIIEHLLEDREKAERWLNNVTRAYFNECARLEGITAELSRINTLKSNTAKKIERLKEAAGRLAGGEKRDLGFAQVSYRTSEAIEIEPGCEERIDDSFLVPKWHVDKNKLKLALKNGEEVPYCSLVQRKNVIIK